MQSGLADESLLKGILEVEQRLLLLAGCRIVWEGEEGVMVHFLLQRPLNDLLAYTLRAHHTLPILALPHTFGELLQDGVVVVLEGVEGIGVVALLEGSL
jgi:hypothetical protein